MLIIEIRTLDCAEEVQEMLKEMIEDLLDEWLTYYDVIIRKEV